MSTDKNIELELRAEISISEFDMLLEKVEKRGRFISRSRRLSVMFLGKTLKSDIDIRIRVNNLGAAEIVIKKGDFHTHNRIETSEPISTDQIMGLTRIFSLLDFSSKVTERENVVFDLGNEISFAIVRAGQIAYVEIEKMSKSDEVEGTKIKLSSILNEMNLNIIENKEEFDELCARLSKLSDWQFNAEQEDFKKLEAQLKSILR